MFFVLSINNIKHTMKMKDCRLPLHGVIKLSIRLNVSWKQAKGGFGPLSWAGLIA